MSDNLFNIGLSGLNSAQWGLNTTGENISNASTPGYTRETTVNSEVAGQYTSSGFSGQGVSTDTVSRAYSSYLNAQMNNATGTSSSLNTYFSLMSQLNNLVGDPTAGLAAGITGYFTSMQSLSTDAATTSTRQSQVSSAQALAGQINTASSTYNQLRDNVNQQLSSSVTSINTYTTQIATLNQQIAVASAQGQPPNQLLDARDLAVTNLSALVAVQVTNANGSYNVTFGSGQPLVVGSTSYQLTTATSTSDPSELSVAYAPSNGTTPSAATTQYIPDSAFTGGAVGGMLQFRDQSLDPAQAQLGAIAASFAAQMNQQNEQGIDQNGNPGGPLFSIGAPTVYANTRNTGTAQLGVSFADPTQPTSADYTLAFDGTNYSLSDRATGQVLGTSTTLADVGKSIGLDLSTTSGTMAKGDSFTIEPTRGVLSSFAVSNTSPAAIAAASPAVTSKPSTNAGTGQISAATVSTGYSIPTNVTLTYKAGPPTTFTSNVDVIVNGSTITAGTAIPYDNTKGLTFATATDVSATISGTPSDGDTFNLNKNTSGTTDGSNALAMANLGSKKSLNGGTDTLTSAYGNFVNAVGNVTVQLQTASTSQTAVLNQVTAAQQSVSGVNLNEEAANLIQYQQLYQANSKVIQTASTLFQTLLGIFN
jgi:flagellar hook-associated protein 1 FlgK